MRSGRDKWLIAALLLVVCVYAAIGHGPFPFAKTIASLAPADRAIKTGAIHPGAIQLDQALRRSVAFAAALLFVLFCVWSFRTAVSGGEIIRRVYPALITIGCAAALFVFLTRLGSEAEWYPLGALMTHPGTLPLFGHRLLFVWPADALKFLVPRLSYLQCYYATQIAAIVLALIAIGEWSAIFIGERLKFIGQLLLVAMLGPTFYYFTFYDIGIVFFFTLSLLLLYRGRYVLFVLALGIGTLNHENTLLLVPLAAFVLWDKKPLRIWAGVPCAGLAAYVAARLAMLLAIPMHTLFYFRVWTNILEVAHPSRALVESALTLVFWWVCVAVALPKAGRFLQRSAILFPMLLAVTVLFGQFHEARQFDAFIPVAIGLILSGVSSLTARPARQLEAELEAPSAARPREVFQDKER